MVAAAIVGSAAIGAVGSSMAAKSAAGAQGDAAEKSDATQRYQYDTTRADNAPFLRNGTAGNNRLSYLLGLSPNGTSGFSTMGGVTYDPNNAFTNPAANAEVNRLSASVGREAAVQQVMAGWNAQINPVDMTAAQAQAGTDPEYGSLLKDFTKEDMEADPVYQSGLQFGLDEGRKGLNNQAAANGSLNSGAVLKALTRFGNDYGSTKAGDAYNRNKANRDSTFNMLSGISGTGQVASNQIGAAGQTMANSISQNQLALGNARGASAIAQGNALTSGMSQAYNGYQQQQMMDIMRNRSGSANGYGASGYGADRTGLGGYDAAGNGGWGIE